VRLDVQLADARVVGQVDGQRRWSAGILGLTLQDLAHGGNVERVDGEGLVHGGFDSARSPGVDEPQQASDGGADVLAPPGVPPAASGSTARRVAGGPCRGPPVRRPCPCEAAEWAAVQHELLCAVATEAPSRERGRLRMDRSALRKALGGREELVEAMGAKAVGRPGANVSRLWAFLTQSLYASGDLPVLSVREQVQNSVAAVRAAVRTRKLR